eukprot:2836861-Lingulodinium_polyedra.AAC.1
MTPMLGDDERAPDGLGPPARLHHVGYADDVTYPLVADTCSDLINALPHASRIIAETWRDGGLQLAPGPSKTAWLLSLRGEGSVQAKVAVAASPTVPLPPGLPAQAIPIVAQYKHLGTEVHTSGRARPALTARARAGQRSIAAVRATTRRGRLPRQWAIRLFEAAAVPSICHNAH